MDNRAKRTRRRVTTALSSKLFSEEEIKAITVAFYRGRNQEKVDESFVIDLQKIINDFEETRIKEALIESIIDGKYAIDYQNKEVIILNPETAETDPPNQQK